MTTKMNYGKPALPTLNLMKVQEHSAAHGQKTARKYGTHEPQPPAGQRRGYGMKGLMGVDATPQTSRPSAKNAARIAKQHHSNHQSTNSDRQPLTARPPANDKTNSGRPGSKRAALRQTSNMASGKEDNNGKGDLPMTPAQALKKYRYSLSEFEQGEILDYPQVYFTGSNAHKLMKTNRSNSNNYGYDDDRGDYHIVTHDHLAYRFEVLGNLGKGSFGQVCKCFDYKENNTTAVKLIRNKKRFHQQALVEVKLLKYIKDRDPHDQANIVRMSEYFYFRNHLCIMFEIMSINLYELIKNNNFQGLSLGLIRRFAVQMLTSLRALRKLRIVHCDLKPENILLRQPNKSGIKIIDFGSSCFEDERVYTYIQSRFYRSPEVILSSQERMRWSSSPASWK